MEIDFIPLEYDYFDFQGRNYALVVGRDSKGKRVAVVDACEVFFWAILKKGLNDKKISSLTDKIKKIKLDAKGRNTRVEKIEIHEKNFLGEKVKALKIFATNYKDMHDIADKISGEKFPEIEKRRGYDLGFVTHYIIERKLIPCFWYKIKGEILDNSFELGGIDMNYDADIFIKAEKIEKKETTDFKPKVVSYDIETDELKIGSGEILMVSIVSEDFKKVLTWKKTKSKKNYVEHVENEEELLEKFVSYVRKLDPDFLVGYFSDGFDLPYLRARADKLKVDFPLGLDNSAPRFSRGIETIGRIKGIVHMDLLKFIRTAYSQYMQSETLGLDEVANEFLNEGKKDFKFKHSSRIKEREWENYFEYNLHDSVLVFELFKKFWKDILEFSRVMQEPIFEVSRNGMSKNVEAFILHNLEKFNEIPEKRPVHDEIRKRQHLGKYEGAFVFEPVPGLYEDIGVFDFTSSYGSTIVTFNLSKSTLLEKPEKNSYSIELNTGKVYFSKKEGFFPKMLREIIELRKKYKKELKTNPDSLKMARSNAFKLLANSSYGYQGFFAARYYSREAAAATAAFARKSIIDAIRKIDKQGYKTIYSDTDSIAFLLNKKNEKQTLEFLKKLNSELPGIMELELEGFFKRGLWVTKRSGNLGAKKKYALIDKQGRMKVRGFETVRRDWCRLARRMQNQVIKDILENGNEKKAIDYVGKIIKELKQRKIPKNELIIKTQLKKPLSEYKAISPHVIAARKMQEQGIPILHGNLIEYYIAETGEKKKLVREKVKLPEEEGEYNIEYYLEHQILPAVENIFQVFNVDIDELIKQKKEKNLSKWF